MANLGINTYVSEGHAELAVDQRRVYFSALKDGDVAVEVKKGDLTGMVYGKVFSPFQTMVYDRKNGTMLAVLPNPPGGQVALAGDRRRLYQTVPGCCGSGIVIVNKDSLAMEQFIDRFATNTVTCANQPSKDWLVGGTEFGIVDLFDLSVAPAALIASVNLPQATGHTVFGDIEIRSLWVDGLDNLVLAGSSWGSDSSHNPDLPSLFVLELRQ